MKLLILIILINTNIFAGGVTGDDTWKSLDVIDLTSSSGVVTGSDTWRKIKDMKNVGDFDFDSDSDRWVLKTKSRLLSVKDIELIDKFEDTSGKINYLKNNFRNLNPSMANRLLKMKVKRMNIVKPYKVSDYLE